MHGNNKKDISNEIMNYKYVTLMSSKMRIGIIGGGKAGEIKTKHFADGKCYVEVLSKTFSDTIKELNNKFPNNVKLVNEEFSYEFLKDGFKKAYEISDSGDVILLSPASASFVGTVSSGYAAYRSHRHRTAHSLYFRKY